MNSGAPQQSTRQPRKRTKGVLKKLQEQIEFYFGDANLPKDKFLQQKISEHPDGYVKVEVIMSFNKVKSLTTDVGLVVRAMKNSSLLEVSEDQLWVRRSTPLPDASDVDLKTIYVENLPVNTADHDMIKKLFKMFGSVTYVSLPRHKVSGAIKGFAFVEFSTQQEAKTAVEYFQCKSGIQTPKGGRKRSTTVTDQTPGKDIQKSSAKEEGREDEGREDKERSKEEAEVEKGVEEEGMEEAAKCHRTEKEEKEREEEEVEQKKSMKRTRKRRDSGSAQRDDDDDKPAAKRHRTEESEESEEGGVNAKQQVPIASREKQFSAEEGGREGQSSGGGKSEGEEGHEKVTEDSTRVQSRKRKREEEEEEKEEGKDQEEKVLQEPPPPTKCADSESERDGGVGGGEGVEGGGGKGKKRNRQHKRKDWSAVLNALNLRVIAKTEWLEMKAMYRDLQKQHIKQLKTEPQRRPGGEGSKQMGFVSQCLVRVKCEGEEVVTCRRLKEVCSKYGEVAFVDTREEGKEYFVRYRTSGCVPSLVENEHLPGVTFTSIEEEEERAYYLETQAARKQQKKLKGRGKMKKRGQDKVISKALKVRETGGVQASHIRFSEDSDTED